MDIDYNTGKSIAELPITDPIHAPCPDMEGTADPQPEKRENSLFRLDVIRERFGISKPKKPEPKPLNYICTNQRCLDPWEIKR